MPQLTIAMLLKSDVVNYEQARNCGALYDTTYRKNYVHIPIWSHRTLRAHVYAFIVALDALPIYYELLVSW